MKHDVFSKCEISNQYWNFTTSKKRMGGGECVAERAPEDKGGWTGWGAHKEYEE